MIRFLSVLRPAAGEPPGAPSWWLITAGSDATKVNRWNPGAKHKRDNIGQTAGYPGSRGSRDPGLWCPRPGSGVLVPRGSTRGVPLRPPRKRGVLPELMGVRGEPPALPTRPGARRRGPFEPGAGPADKCRAA